MHNHSSKIRKFDFIIKKCYKTNKKIDTIDYVLILKLVRLRISGYDIKFEARKAKVHHSHFNAYKPGKFEGLSKCIC